MTAAQSTRFSSLQNSPNNKNVHLVSTLDVRTFLSSDTLSFQIPGKTGTLTAVANGVHESATEGYSWSGSLISEPGYMTLLYLNNRVSGFIQADTNIYEILPMDSIYQFLVERDISSQPDCGTVLSGLDPGYDPLGQNDCGSWPNEFEQYNTCPAIIRVLLVVTDEAKTWILENYGSITAFALEGQSLIKMAFANSDIPNKEVRISWIERNYSSSLTIEHDIETDAQGLENLIGTDRSNALVDVAFLITRQGYDNIAGAVAEIGPDNTQAFGIVEADYFNSIYTFEHEFGHLLGCRHNWPKNFGNDATETPAHAFRQFILQEEINYENINDVSTFRTIVALPLSNNYTYQLEDEEGNPYLIQFTDDKIILHYSNPDVLYSNVPTGTVCANCAHQIQNTACEVAGFFFSTELNVQIGHENTPCIASKQFTALIDVPDENGQGQPPYTLSWSWSPYFNFSGGGTFLGTGTTLNLQQHPHCPTYWLKCTVTSSDNFTVTSIQKISLALECCTAPGGGGGIGKAIPQTNIHHLSIFPNPVVSDYMLINSDNSIDHSVAFEISTTDGKIMKTGKLIFDAHVSTAFTGNLSAGTYFLTVRFENGERQTLSFTIQK